MFKSKADFIQWAGWSISYSEHIKPLQVTLVSEVARFDPEAAALLKKRNEADDELCAHLLAKTEHTNR